MRHPYSARYLKYVQAASGSDDTPVAAGGRRTVLLRRDGESVTCPSAGEGRLVYSDREYQDWPSDVPIFHSGHRYRSPLV